MINVDDDTTVAAMEIVEAGQADDEDLGPQAAEAADKPQE